jgi:Pectate lyase superfamily protein
MPATVVDTFVNFISSAVAGGALGTGNPLLIGDTSLLLNTGDGAKCPPGGQFMVLLGTVTGTHELLQATGHTGDTLTGLVRGGSLPAPDTNTAFQWPVGTLATIAIASAGVLTRLYSRIQAAPINVKDYGAKGDGVTDDTAAINAAFTAAVGGKCYLPAGTYMVSGTTGVAFGGNTSLIIPATGNIEIFGDGPGVTIIKHVGGSANENILAGGTTFACPNVTIRDLTINGNGSVGYGVALQFADLCTLENITVLGANALITCFALWDGSTGRNLVVNCHAIGGGASCLQGFEMGAGEIGTQMIGCTATSCLNGFQFDAGTNTFSGSNKNQFCRLESCEAYACLSGGFNLLDMQDCEVVDCIAQGNTHFGLATTITNLTAATFRLRVTGGAYKANGNGGANNSGVWLVGNRSAIHGADISNNNAVGLVLASCASTLVEDCHFWDDQGSPTQLTGIFIPTANTWSGFCTGNRFDATVTTTIGGTGTNSSLMTNNQGLNFIFTAALTVTASPFTYTNTTGRPQFVIITGGTVSLVQWRRPPGSAVNVLAASNNTIWLAPGDLIIVTYSVLPTMFSIDM